MSTIDYCATSLFLKARTWRTVFLFSICDPKDRRSLIALIFWTKPVAAETYTVKMGSDTNQLKFVPETLEIKSGDTVKWVNNQIPPHNVVFEGDKVPNGDKALADKISHKKLLFTKGDSFETTFSDAAAGSYSYYC